MAQPNVCPIGEKWYKKGEWDGGVPFAYGDLMDDRTTPRAFVLDDNGWIESLDSGYVSFVMPYYDRYAP